MKKILYLLFLLLPSFVWGQSQSITMQFRSFGQRYPMYTWSGIPGGGYDTLFNSQRLRELFKLKADSVNNDGYVTHGYFNSHISFLPKAGSGITIGADSSINLNGAITQNTIIPFSNYVLAFGDLPNTYLYVSPLEKVISMAVLTAGAGGDMVIDGGGSQMGAHSVSSGDVVFKIDTLNGMIVNDPVNKKGIRYSFSDYTHLGDSSLIPKKLLDSVLVSRPDSTTIANTYKAKADTIAQSGYYTNYKGAQAAKLARKYPESNMPDTVIASAFTTVSVNPNAVSKDDIRLTTRYGRMAQVPGSFPNTSYNRPTYVTGTSENPFAAFEFVYDGNIIEFFYYETGTSQVRYYVDGQRVNSGTAYPITDGGSVGGLLYQTLTFNNAKRRVIRVEGIGDFRWGNVKTQTGFNIYKSSSFFTNVILFGDSYDEGTGANWWTGWPVVLGKKNNWNVWASGSGGTGYVATGSVGTRFDFKDRLITDVFPYNPEYLWMSGGINDVSRISSGTWTHAQYLARIDSTIASIRTNLPNLKELVVTSSWWPADTNKVSQVVVDSCIRVTAVKYKATYINTRGIFTGSGHVGAPTGIGNADSLISSDGVHPTTIGHQYLGEQLLIRYYITKAQQTANWAAGANSSPPVHDQPINTLNDITTNRINETGNFEQLATDAALTLDTYHKQITLPIITANRAITLPTGFANFKFTLININTAGFTWSLPATTVYFPDGITTLTTLTNGQIYNIEYSITQAKYIVISTSVFSGIVSPSQGGTGIANSNSNTITLGGVLSTASAFATTGAFSLTFNTTASTLATVPSGTVTLYSTKSSSMNSAQLSGSLTDETGTGAAVFKVNAALTTPDLGTPSAATLTNATGLPTAGLVNNAVTYAKMQAMTTGRLLGSGTGTAVAEITPAVQAATGETLVYGASTITLGNDTSVVRTVANSYSLSGMQTKLNATTTAMVDNILSKTANYTIVGGDFVAGKKNTLDLYVDATAGAVVITLPSATTFAGYTIYVTKTDAGVNTVTINTVLGSNTLITQYQERQFNSNATSWYNH